MSTRTHPGWMDRRERLAAEGLYDPAQERDGCGVGMVVSIDGTPSRAVVEGGINALKVLWHRGAVDADGKTGDGAGIHVQIPQDFFAEHIARTGHKLLPGQIAVGQVFLPRTDYGAQETCRTIVESEILRFGYVIYGWRQTPVEVAVIGEKANATRPEIEQIMIANTRGVEEAQFELDLYVIRRRIEKAVIAAQVKDFYICSLSCRSIIYKGMFLAEQLTAFYPDLLDHRFVSNFAIYHQRYSTNTFATWSLAQPFRVLAHNGEINTLRGNVNWMRSHEARLEHDRFGSNIEDVKPVIQSGNSDSAALDTVAELMVRAGRSLPMVKTMLIPDSWTYRKTVPENHQALYAYANGVMEPWDGPAAICAFGGRWAVAGMDRNGLRPLRYTLTSDGLLVVGSETGMIPVEEQRVLEKGRVGPGEMIGVDLVEGRFMRDLEMKDWLAGRQDYASWNRRATHLDALINDGAPAAPQFDRESLRRRQIAVGWTMEELELILHPMAEEGKEATGSMGDDTPPAVLSDHYRGLHHFFRQSFSQVTNPPIDSLRERRIMSLKTRLGNLGNILAEEASQCDMLQLETPVLLNAEFDALAHYVRDEAVEIDCTFDPTQNGALREALNRICLEAEHGTRGGRKHIILSDRNVGNERAPVPMILATGAVHTHLVRQELRTYTSLNIRSAECFDVHYFAVLIGCGATTINAYLAEESIATRHAQGLFGDLDFAGTLQNYKTAVSNGLLKIMSKMGIAVISSYRGGLNFEAVGLSRNLVAEFFPGMPSRISGIGLPGIQHKVASAHKRAWSDHVETLPVGGFYRYRRSGEQHGFDGTQIHMLQNAVAIDSYSSYRKYSQAVHAMPPVHLRDLMDFDLPEVGVPPEAVESITRIRKRLVAPGISLGALSPEAHETLSIAMNRIGAKSDSGEGGEDPARYQPRANGDNASSAIKQVASGRFGVTAEYLNNCREIEIKIAQGAKPGEGGQLPGFKVSNLIAKLRHSTPGVTLISPPPHHDIYSIEDLAQLVYDLKQINPDASVCVKLVAQNGIGTVAAGVAKAMADVILISGHNGGTGASPQSSIKYAGIPWEMGLSEVHQVLSLNRLRHRVRLRTDGGLKTGRDVVIAAMLGAEEFGIGTTALVAMGCIMVRQCHMNTCPVGVCTQDDSLREKFAGTPEKVINLFTFIAEEVREILAKLGMRSLEEVIGRTDLLSQVSRGAAHLDDLDLNPLLVHADTDGLPAFCTLEERNPVPETLEAQMMKDAKRALEAGEKVQLAYNISNTQRSIGTRLSSFITRKYGMTGLPDGHITLRLRGSAGQSLGAFAVQGVRIEVLGDANDYVGKGLSGGTIIVRPPASSLLQSHHNVIIGNTVMYGATSGTLMAAGQAGERFCVRNSGATAVVEGVGSNGCEYMTGGLVAILGPVGDNFAAGMTGGMAFAYDPDNRLENLINDETVIMQRVETLHWDRVLRGLVERHAQLSHSAHAEGLLREWDLQVGKFWQVVPKDLIAMGALDAPLKDESMDQKSA